jgi:hypothetical protein
MSRTERVFNPRKRRVFRSRIPDSEIVFGAVFVAVVVGMAGWVYAQRDRYDPSERDISMQLMEAGSVEDTLYRSPLVRWMDPAQAAAAVAGAVDLGIFPATTLDGGWTPSTRVQVFDEATLYEKINGAAPQYFAFGFEMLHFVGIEHRLLNVDMNIELYDMGAFENALGIFAAQRDASRAVEVRNSVYYYPTSIGAIGIVERFYFKFTGSDEDPLLVDKANELIDAFTALPGGAAGAPRAFVVLRDVLGIPFEGIVFEKTDVFQFQFAENFWFGQPDLADDFRYYVHEAPTEEAAIALYDNLLENHLYDYDELSRTEDAALLNHKFLDTRLALTRTGRWLFGFDGASAELDAEQTLMHLQEAFLSDEEI